MIAVLLFGIIAPPFEGVASARKSEFTVTTQQQHAAKTAAQSANWGGSGEPTYRDAGRVTAPRARSGRRVRVTRKVKTTKVVKHSHGRRRILRVRAWGIPKQARSFNLLTSLGAHFHGTGDVVQRAKAHSKARQSLLDRKGLRGRIRDAGFDDQPLGTPLTRASYVRMGAVEQFFRKIDAMIMGGRVTHNDLRIENVRVSPDGTLALAGWKQAQVGGDARADLHGQQRLRSQIDQLLYH